MNFKIFLACLIAPVLLQAAVEGAADSTSNASMSENVFEIKKNYDAEGIEIYDSNLQMRSFKRLGVNAQVGGAVGIFGVNAEFNYEPSNAVLAGFGMGPGFNSFNARWKHSFVSNYLSPFVTAGYSKWFNTNGSSISYKDSEVLNRVLTDDEKASGRFGADFGVASAGLEYTQLEGELSGMTFFGEVVLLHEIKRSTLVPTGSVGVGYFF